MTLDTTTGQLTGMLHSAAWLARSGPDGPHDPAATEPLGAHTRRLGARPRGDATLVDELAHARVSGHGGAHVPTALRWTAALRRGGPLTVVANGAESEPLSAKDVTLLRQHPHLVLDGLALAAETLGARRAVVWLHGDDVATSTVVRAAVAERRAARVAEPWLEVVNGPSHYLAGESSAIGRALAGGPALPAARGRRGSHTFVQNAETLARIALVARGIPPVASTLLTVLTPVGRHVLEVERGTTAAHAVARAGSWRDGPPQAVLLGGFGGAWVPWHVLEGMPLDEVTLRAAGLSLGAGVVAPIPYDACGLAETAAIAAYLAAMSARQCGPCLFGLPALAESMRVLAAGTAPRRERVRLLDDLRAVAGRGACHHPDGATRLIASALDVFATDLAEHERGRPCAGSDRLTLPVPVLRAAEVGA